MQILNTVYYTCILGTLIFILGVILVMNVKQFIYNRFSKKYGMYMHFLTNEDGNL